MKYVPPFIHICFLFVTKFCNSVLCRCCTYFLFISTCFILCFPLLCFCGCYFFPLYNFKRLFPDRCFSSNLYPTTLLNYPISCSRFPLHSLGFLSRHNDNFVSSFPYILSHAVMLPKDFHEGVE